MPKPPPLSEHFPERRPKLYNVTIRRRETGAFVCWVDIRLTDAEANTLTVRTRMLLERLRDERILAFNSPVDIIAEEEQ